MRRVRRSYPAHPYPLLLAQTWSQQQVALRLTNFEVKLLARIKHGARVLFDMEQGRALLYAFRRGIEELGEVTVRTLARLVQAGHLYVSGREGRLVHFNLAGAAPIYIPSDQD